MAGTIFQAEFFMQLVFPFLLVFALIFAVLDKTKILGEGKRQINAIIALVIGLIFVSFSAYVDVVVPLVGIAAVVAVILLVFMLLFAFASSKGEFEMPKGLKITFGVLIAITLVISLLYFTGYWDNVVSSVSGGNNVFANVLFVAIIIGAIVAVVWGGKSS